MQAVDGRVGQVVRVKELGLGHAAAAPFAVPPAGPVRVEVRARGARDGDARAFDLEEGAVPFCVAPGCFAFEDDLGGLRVSKSVSLAGRGGDFPPLTPFFPTTL